MIASIGPFWDANETWLVLGVGILLVAFPVAHGVILSALYIPVLIMLVGLTLRGIAFDLRTKANIKYKQHWEKAFQVGSLMTALAQGYMLGSYIVGFGNGWDAVLFSMISAVCVAASYVLIGACWLVLKATDSLQLNAIRWAKKALVCTAIGLVSVSFVNPWVSERIFDKWFAFPQLLGLGLLPAGTALLMLFLYRQLTGLSIRGDKGCCTPLLIVIAIFILSFIGLAYSFYPYVVPDKITIWQAASSIASLQFILYGVIIVLPAIIGYTLFAHWVFWGKAKELSYE